MTEEGNSRDRRAAHIRDPFTLPVSLIARASRYQFLVARSYDKRVVRSYGEVKCDLFSSFPDVSSPLRFSYSFRSVLCLYRLAYAILILPNFSDIFVQGFKSNRFDTMWISRKCTYYFLEIAFYSDIYVTYIRWNTYLDFVRINFSSIDSTN